MPVANRPEGGGNVNRRQVLKSGAIAVAAPALLLAGCGLRVGSAAPPTTVVTPLSADETARERAAQDSDELLALVRRVRALRPDVARVLKVLADDHQVHAAALRRTSQTPGTRPTPTTSSMPGPTPAETRSGTAAPGLVLTRATALAVLLDAEQRGRDALLLDLDAVSADVARLLASVSASRAVHVAALQPLVGATGGPR